MDRGGDPMNHPWLEEWRSERATRRSQRAHEREFGPFDPRAGLTSEEKGGIAAQQDRRATQEWLRIPWRDGGRHRRSA